MINRYSIDSGTIKKNDNGRFVTYADHKKEVDQLYDQISELGKEIRQLNGVMTEADDCQDILELALLKLLQEKHSKVCSGPTW